METVFVGLVIVYTLQMSHQDIRICNTCGVSNVQRGSVSTLTVTSNSHSESDFTVKPEQLNQNQVLNIV